MVRPNWFEEHPPACTCSACQAKRNIREVHGKVSRNQKCPCGSGKKFKKCHGQ